MVGELNRALHRWLAVVMLLVISVTGVADTSDGHLLPAGPNFDTSHAAEDRAYVELLDKMLFPAQGWIARYFRAVGEPSPGYDTGIALYRKPNGSYWLMIKQASPALGSIVMNAYRGRINLKSSLAAVKIKTSNKEVPAEFAAEMSGLWVALLRDSRPDEKPSDEMYFSSPTVIFSAKNSSGNVLNGKYPPDAAKHENFVATEAFVDTLFKSCDMPDNDRIQSLRRVARRMSNLRHAVQLPTSPAGVRR